MERSISERLDMSAASIHIDPVGDETPSGLKSDCLASFFDDHLVLDDCGKNSVNLNEALEWVKAKIEANLPRTFLDHDPLRERIRERYKGPSNPAGDFSIVNRTVEVIDQKWTMTADGRNYAKFWFVIL